MVKTPPYHRACLILIILGQAAPYSFWFGIKTDGRLAHGLAVGGPNYEYLVHGYLSYMDMYQVDWTTGTFTRYKTIEGNQTKSFNVGGNRYTMAEGSNALVIGQTLVTASVDPSTPSTFTDYASSLPTSGLLYNGHIARGTSYMFFGAKNQVGGLHKLRRVLIDSTNDLKEYTIEVKTETYGVLFGTTFVVASLVNNNKRVVFDYTKGYDGGPTPGPLTNHFKPLGPNEESAFISLQDGRGYYVVATNGATATDQGIATVKEVDGSERLALALTGVQGDPQSFSWIYDTDYLAGATWRKNFFFVNFMDETKSSKLTVGLFRNGELKSKGTFIWEDKRVFAFHVTNLDGTEVDKILEEMPCSDLCLTCEDIWRKKCVTCQPNSSLTAGAGSPCSCDPNYYEVKKGYTTKECLQCHAPLCGTCSSGAEGACLTCLWTGGFVDSGVCKTCDNNESPSCPAETKIEITNGAEELDENITMKFTPPLNQSLPSDFQLSAELLTTKHFTIQFKRKGSSEAPITITKQTLSHQQDSSLLIIEFLEKFRVDSTEHLKIVVQNPWLHRSKTTDSIQKIAYFKKNDILAKIEKKEETAQDQDLRQAAQAAKATRAVVGAAASTSIVSAAISGAGSSVVYLIKFFNILEIISNVSQLNVKYGPKIEVMNEFIDNLKIPQIGFLARLSPIKDLEYDDPDVNAYLTRPRGSRGKMTTSNSEIYLGSGQNFIISCTIILLWILLKSLGRCLEKKSKILGFLAFFYQVLIGLTFFDYQLICVNEISMFDYSTLRKTTPKFNLSLFLSLWIMGLIMSEFFQGFWLVKATAPRATKTGLKADKIEMSANQKLILEKYTEGLEVNIIGQHRYFVLIDSLRFFAIQVITATLQLLNRSQALMVFVVNLCYFIYFIRLVFRIGVFDSKLLFVKYLVQESSMMVLIATITLFSFTEDSKFSSSTIFKGIEVVTMISMLGAAGAEFVVMATNMYWDLTKCCRKKSKKVGSISEVEKAKAAGSGSADPLRRESGATGWSESLGENSSLKGNKKANRRSTQGKELAKKNKILSGKQNEFRESSDPFGGLESESRQSKEKSLKRGSVRSGRLRQLGVPVMRKVKKEGIGSLNSNLSGFEKKKIEADSWDFS